MLSHQRLQSPLFSLQQLPLLVGLLFLDGLDLTGPAGLVLDAQVLRPQPPLPRLFPLKLLLDLLNHLLLDLPQLLHPLAVAAVDLLQLPLYVPPPPECLLLDR